MFAVQSTNGAVAGDWVRDGLNEDEGGGNDDAVDENDHGRDYALGDDYDGEERDDEDLGSENEEDEEEEEEEEQADDGDGSQAEDDDGEQGGDCVDSSDGRDENGSSGQSDLDAWYAQVTKTTHSVPY